MRIARCIVPVSHVVGTPNIQPVSRRDFVFDCSGVECPVADAGFFFRPDAVDVVERVVHGRLGPEEIAFGHA